MDIRARISDIIGAQSLSIRKLAAMSGVRRQSIMAFLDGANLSIDNLQKLAQALGFELDVVVPERAASSSAAETRFRIRREELVRLCRKYGISRLALFGSILGRAFRPDSDIDVLVELKKPVSFFTLDAIREELEKAVRGRHRIDLVTAGALSPYIRKEILASCEVLYEEAA